MTTHAPSIGGQWRELAFASWRVSPDLLAPLLPAGVELDVWEGHCWLSLVGLRFLDLAVAGVPVPLHGEFAQVNLRFYVRRVVDGELRAGVVFVRELVPHATLAAVARLTTNEPMSRAEVEATIECASSPPDHPASAAYTWDTHPGRGTLRLATAGAPTALARSSIEEFFAERCWGYSAQRDGGTVEYRVEHPRWSVFPVRDATVSGDLAASFPVELARVMTGPPDHAMLAEGSAVTIHPPARV